MSAELLQAKILVEIDLKIADMLSLRLDDILGSVSVLLTFRLQEYNLAFKLKILLSQLFVL